MPAVKSSMLSHVDHKDGTLIVKFQNGTTYSHPDVPEEKYKAMLASPSVGKFYNAEIKGKHPHY